MWGTCEVAGEAAVDVGLYANEGIGRQLVQVDLDLPVAVSLLALPCESLHVSERNLLPSPQLKARPEVAASEGGAVRTVGTGEACWIMVRTSMIWCDSKRFTFWLSRARSASSSSGLS
jgi:hypothetical protein